MASLTICDEADRELDALYETHPDDAALIDVLLEELGADEEALTSLCRDVPKWAYMANPPYEVKRFASCWRLGKEIYILRVYDADDHLCNHRVIIAHDPATDDYMVLATPHRDFNYDTESAEFLRIVDRYDAAGFLSFR